MTPFFSSTFYALFVTFIFIFGNSQNSFSCGVPFGPFWSVKYLNFGQKLPIRTTHHTFLESRHPEVTKNQYYVLSPEWRQKKVSAHGLHLLPSIDTTDKVKFCYLTRLQYDYYEIKITFLELNTLQQYFYKCLKNLDYLSSNILI